VCAFANTRICFSIFIVLEYSERSHILVTVGTSIMELKFVIISTLFLHDLDADF
jgi:hypothetical protein